MITVGIITKDRQEFLPATLGSLIGKFKGTLIIADEGTVDTMSNAAIRKILSSFAETGVDVVYTRHRNKGIPKLRQYILDKCLTDKLCYMDDDVILSNGTLFDLERFLKYKEASYVAGCVIESDRERKFYFKSDKEFSLSSLAEVKPEFYQYCNINTTEPIKIPRASTSLCMFDVDKLRSNKGFTECYHLKAGSDSYVTQRLKGGFLLPTVVAYHLSTEKPKWDMDFFIETEINKML